MAQLTTLENFFPIQLGVLKENLAVTFALYVYLPLNKRLVQLRRPNEILEEGFLVVYGNRGIAKLYVSKNDHAAYIEYIRKEKEKENEVKAEDAFKDLEAKTQMFEELKKKDKTEQDSDELPIEGAFSEDPDAPGLSEDIGLTEQQAAALKGAVKTLMNGNKEERAVAMEDVAAIAEAVVTEGESKQSLFTDLWQNSAEDKFDGHAKNVATFAVIFGLGMGYKNRETIKSLSLAGLVHDLGVCQIDIETVRTPQELRSAEQTILFQDHMRTTIEMLAGLRLGLPAEALKILAMHHEKFDGTGYPKKLKNWDVNALAQVLSMADVFDGMIRGRYDGRFRNLTEAFKDVVTLEKSKIFPQYYNPDLFNKLVKWVETQSDTTILTEADKIVADTVDSNLKKPAA